MAVRSGSFFDGDVAADDAFEVAVLGAEEERAVGVEGFGATFNFVVAGADGDALAKGGAMFFPLIGEGFEAARGNARIVTVEFAEDFDGELGAVLAVAGLYFERGDELAQFGGELAGGGVHVDADAEDDVFDLVELGAEFGEDAGDFFSADEDVIWPFDFRREAGLLLDGAEKSRGGGDGDLGCGGGAHVGPQEDGKGKAAARRGNPFAAKASPAFRLGLGEDDSAFTDAVAREFFDDVVGGGGLREDTDVAADGLDGAEAGEQVVRVQHVRHADEAVAEVRAGLDFVAENAEFLNARPDGGAADAELMGEIRAGDTSFTSGAEGGEDFGVNGHGSDFLEIEADVHGAGGMGERADGNVIHAGFGNGADIGEIDAAAGLGQGAALHFFHGETKLNESHVVQEDNVGGCGDGLINLFECIGLDFNLEFGITGAGAGNGGGDGIGRFIAQGGEMVVLDEDHVIEAMAVISATAAGDGIFLKAPPPGSGFTDVEDFCVCASDGFDELGRQRGDAGEALDKIKGGAFGGEQGAGGPGNFKEDLAVLEGFAVGGDAVDLDGGGKFVKGHFGEGETGDDERLAGFHHRLRGGVFGNSGESGGVAVADVLGKGELDSAADFVIGQKTHKTTAWRRGRRVTSRFGAGGKDLTEQGGAIRGNVNESTWFQGAGGLRDGT